MSMIRDNQRRRDQRSQRLCAVALIGLLAGSLAISTVQAQSAKPEFGGYYAKLDSGEDWEKTDRTGKYADVIVNLENGLQFIFWRASSYLPHLKTATGLRYVDELIPRKGNGSGLRPDNFNWHSHVRLIEKNPARVVVHWRYAPDIANARFTDFLNSYDGKLAQYYADYFDEYFTVYPDGLLCRTAKRGIVDLAEWNDPAHVLRQEKMLLPDGIAELPTQWKTPPAMVLNSADYELRPFNAGNRSHVVKSRKRGMPGTLRFALQANKDALIRNPAVVVEGWGEAPVASLTWAGSKLTPGKDYRAGYVSRLEGKDLVVWFNKESVKAVAVTIVPGQSTPVENMPPKPCAGDNQSLLVTSESAGPYEVNLAGKAEDDGLPGSTLTTVWSLAEGSGTVKFADAKALVTKASVPGPGVYRFRLTADDGSLTASDDVTVVVNKQAQPGAVVPVLSFSFETANENKSVWEGNLRSAAGIFGNAVRLDGYTTAVVCPAETVPDLGSTNGFSVEAWIAPQEYPWNWCGIVDHSQIADHSQDERKKAGFALKLDNAGLVAFGACIDSWWKEIVSPQPISLLKWTHVAGVYDDQARTMSLYVNGKNVARRVLPRGGFKPEVGADLLIGKSHIRKSAAESCRAGSQRFKTEMVLNALVDEVKIYGQALSGADVEAAFASVKHVNPQPLHYYKMPSGPRNIPRRFGAYYTRLQYAAEWDNMWRVGDHPDIVVTFDESPVRTVFWRGTQYCPALVTENGIWVSDQGPEVYHNNECHEMMSDKQCRYAHVRVIESHEARAIVHWRNASVNPSLTFFPYRGDNSGQGEWTDEYYYIYPDATMVRYQEAHGKSARAFLEMQQSELLNQPGTRPQDNIHAGRALTVATMDGEKATYTCERVSWERLPMDLVPGDNPISTNATIQYLNLKADHKHFVIGEEEAEFKKFHFPPNWRLHSTMAMWIHWPVGLLPDDGINAVAPDRPSSTCISTLREQRHYVDDNLVIARNLYGLTRQPIDQVIRLARSWNRPASLAMKGGNYESCGYDKNQRAYVLTVKDIGTPVRAEFSLMGTPETPVINPAFVLKDWNADMKAGLVLNGRPLVPGAEYRQGIEKNADGSRDLVVWLKLDVQSTVLCRIMASSGVPDIGPIAGKVAVMPGGTTEEKVAPSADVSLRARVGTTVPGEDAKPGRITQIPYEVTPEQFTNAVTVAEGATVAVYQEDGRTPAAGCLKSGYKIVVTAPNGRAKAEYLLDVLPRPSAVNIILNNKWGQAVTPGWTRWTAIPRWGNSLALDTGVGSFAADFAVDGTVDIRVTTSGNTGVRNFDLKNVTGTFAETPAVLWESVNTISSEWFSMATNALTITLGGLQAGRYELRTYHYQDAGGMSNTVAHADVFINNAASGIVANSYNRGATAATLEAEAVTKIPFTVVRDRDPVTVEFRNLRGDSAFTFNGLQLRRRRAE